jgi:hypothetical protein
MSYYIFNFAVNTLEVGSQFPQIQKMSPEYNYKAFNSVYELSKLYDDFPDFTPNLDYFVLVSRAKLTDLLSVSVLRGGFLISEELKTIFDKFKISSHKYYRAKVKYGGIYYENYYWMHIVSDLTSFVNYQNSLFFVYHNFSQNLGEIEIISKEDLLQKEKKIKSDNPGKTIAIWAKKIELLPTFDKSLDLFKISRIDGNFYISENLKNAIVNKKISGLNILEANNLEISKN